MWIKFGWIAGLIGLASPALADRVSCDGFKSAVLRDSGDLKAEFARPLVVSRGAGSGLDAFDLVTRARIDGVLRCQGDVFVSFEARIAMPADGELMARFSHVQQAAVMAVLGWDGDRAKRRILRYGHEAADFLRGSAERGDVAVAGKFEEHLPGAMDIGLIWTQTDRTFLLVHNP